MSAPPLLRIDDASPAGAAIQPCALVIGNFDGVHRGHQAVVREAVALAAKKGLRASVLTFDPHPVAVVGQGAPPMLTTLEHRGELLAAMGVERVVVRTFDASFGAWEPSRFARELVARTLAARVVVVGQNFLYGARRAGDLTLLRAAGKELGFEVHVHAIASDAHGAFSSTRARQAVATGNMQEIEAVLARPHVLSGEVVRGQERGRTIGFPTANLQPLETLPPDGVYAVRVDELPALGPAKPLGGGVTNIGMRPTVGGTARTVETFLFDLSRDLYGVKLRVHLVARLRDERKFDGLDELKAQIAIDCASAKAALVSAAA